MKKLIVAWVAGFVCAMALVVRWQRIGNAAVQPVPADSEPTPTPMSPATEATTPTSGGVRGFASAGWESVLAGARADLGGLRQIVGRMRPEGAPSLHGVGTIDLSSEGVSAAG